MKHHYNVETEVTVQLDESKFTPEWMKDFSSTFFRCDTLDGHRQHLAEMFATGMIEGRPSEFVEGYGILSEMGIVLTSEGTTSYKF